MAGSARGGPAVLCGRADGDVELRDLRLRLSAMPRWSLDGANEPGRGPVIGQDGRMGFIPVGDLMRELVLALGAAMVVGSVAVVVRERRRTPTDTGPKPSRTVVTLNLVLGLVLTVWGLGSIIAAR